jgi:hypothetical protein
MTYIYEMASGTEYPGEEFRCPTQTAAMTAPAAQTHPARGEYQVELRLVPAETLPSRSVPSGFRASLNLNDLFKRMED